MRLKNALGCALACIVAFSGAWVFAQSCDQGCVDATCWWVGGGGDPCIKTSAPSCNSEGWAPEPYYGEDCDVAPEWWPKSVGFSCMVCSAECGSTGPEVASGCDGCFFLRNVDETACGDLVWT